MTAYRTLAEALERVASSRGRLAKVAILAEALRALPPGELVVGARLLSGSPFAEWEESVTSVGWATVVKAAVAVTGWTPDTIRACASAIGDLGEAVSLLMPRRTENGLTVPEVDALFRSIAAARKAAERGALLEGALQRSSAVEAKYLLKTLSGGLRIGADVTTVEEAIAAAFSAEREAVARARRDSGDVGETAAAARAGTLDAIAFRLFHPIGFMLASPIEEAEEVEPELTAFAVEDKFDGIRAHAHKDGSRVALFSRTLDEVTAQFPEIAEALGRTPGMWLLDGEIVAWRDGEREGAGRPDSFFKLQRRLGRKSPEPKLLAEIPARFVAYDCLAADGRPLFEAPWSERRVALEEIAGASRIALSEVASATTAGELEALFVRARERGNEGLVLKRRDSLYQAGKRGRAWRKWKKALATLDVVVTAVEQGHGKRAGMLSDYTFAVRDGDRFVNIGKAYSGLTDEEIKRLGTRFRRETVERYGPVRAVQPTLVIEVAFDTIQKSARHKSGFALRFPRIVRLREDKPVKEITTLDDVRELYARVSREGDVG
ncbi:MAG TPA: ATP-dependent DNA ligase [Thermoanaerobaculia bacterium]|nr:ATP-dependent DNA ligase [Thermoanaerobaculia bacterium]